ncbi:MAG: gliding motility-associated C-terminal domain-containing protein [Algibacter sp.]
MKNSILLKIIIIFIFSITELISAQIVISKPNLEFTQACASATFNNYNVTFTFSPVSNLAVSNQFEILLSDDTGDFTSATTIYTSTAGSITTSPVTIPFSLPTTISGEGYKLKIKSTDPIATSSASNAFAAYYKIQDTPFSINNLIETGVYCTGGNYLLTIDNPGGPMNDSPLQYPSLTFNWYKETGPTTSVFMATSSTLLVNQPGTYFAETNYGTCTSNSFSNRVTISEASTTGITSSINSSLGNPYCASEGATTLNAINGNSYQWFKEGNQIDGATNQMYVTNESGNYSVNINLGDCTASASIVLENNGFDSSIDVLDINLIEENETLIATVATDAVNPEFKWFLNAIQISGETSASYEATQIGDYKVSITQTVGCISTKEFLFEVKEPIELFPDVSNIPNLISPNNDGVNDTWVIPQDYVSGTNTEVVIISSQGEMVLQTKDYQNNWPTNQINFKSINPVYYYIITTENNQTRKGSITVVK